MLTNIILFIIYPASVYLLSKDIKTLIISYVLSIILLLVLSHKKRRFNQIILDSSIMNDSRVVDIINSNLFDRFLLPKFVLKEIESNLKKTNDSFLKQNLKQVRQSRKVKIVYRNYYNIKSTEFKIIRLAKSLKTKIITANFHLTKIASMQNVKVIDINDLHERLKPTVLPGHKIPVFLVKEGKERNQAIGFLDDGTTVVVENARNFINKKVTVKISSMLHSSTNKMVFGKISNEYILEDNI